MTSATAARGKPLRRRRLTGNIDFRSLQSRWPERYPFLLQSAASGPDRYDILFVKSGEPLVLQDLRSLVGPGAEDTTDFLTGLDNWWRACRTPETASGLPFHGGWFLYLGYELAGQIEPTLQLRADDGLPMAFAVRCKSALIREHASGAVYAVAEHDASEFEALLKDAHDATRALVTEKTVSLVTTVEDEPRDFLDAVSRAKEYIAAGDIYQANLSRNWYTTVAADADAVYARLCDTNPAPFAGLVRWKDIAIMSSSPERLITVRGGKASTRPIAGTRPRADDELTDSAMSDELFDHPKERAEHVMLIDLERNDLGRVCQAGTVEVNEYMVLESYAHVHHIVSNVQGVLRPDVTPGEAIRAVFPGGTITGCPKVRCMEIISELEKTPRGAYTGSFGYLNTDGSMDLNILIRTMVMQGNTIRLSAGSGIVADSEPEAELAETRAKAKGLLLAFR